MPSNSKTLAAEAGNDRFFDGFTKTILTVMCLILLFIFAAGNYMNAHGMGAGGTDNDVNDLATSVAHKPHHPFAELPGDAEVGAFSVANFFAGLIVGYHWLKLFGPKATARAAEENQKEKEE